jgi:O-methyltransferase
MKKLIKKIIRGLGFDLIKREQDSIDFWPVNAEEKVVHYQMDVDFHFTYDEAQRKTQMLHSDNSLRRLRHYNLRQLFKNTLKIQGNVVECGTFHGLSAFQISKIMVENDAKRIFHIFDSFEGLSKIEEEDTSGAVSISDQELRSQFAYGEQMVRDNLSEFDFIEYYKGWIPVRFSEVKNESFSFVHIDVDLYQPIKDCIEFFYPKLNKGGIMLFDDYGFTVQFPGAKKAVDEFIAESNVSFFISLPSGQAFIIK